MLIITKMVSAKIWWSNKSAHKYGDEVSTSLEHACEIDRKNENRLWHDAQGDGERWYCFDIFEDD